MTPARDFSVVVASRPKAAPTPAPSRKRPREDNAERSKTPTPIWKEEEEHPLPSGFNGCSAFYNTDNPSRKLATKLKEAVREDVPLRRSSRRFKPRQNLQPGPKDWRNLYASKLKDINGPTVTLKSNQDVEFSFEVINAYKLQAGVERVDVNFHAGCDCAGSCSARSCTCLSQEEDSDLRIVPYTSGSGGQVVLDPSFMKRKAMIYECSPLCGCDPGCWNRVVERGRTVRLEVFQTRKMGLGLSILPQSHCYYQVLIAHTIQVFAPQMQSKQVNI